MHFPRFGGGGSSATPSTASSSSGSSSSSSKSSSDKEQGDGSFDPASLERGAEALKEIDKSKHAIKVFELVQMEEKTLQMEAQANVEKVLTQKAQSEMQSCVIDEQEAQKTISKLADAERAMAQHKAQLEAELQRKKLECNQRNTDYQLQREHELFVNHEQIRMRNDQELEEFRLQTIRDKAKMDQESAVHTARAEAAGRAQQERENIEIRLREMRAQKAEERRTRLLAIEEVFTSVQSGARTLYEDRAKATALLTGFTALALGVFGAREGVRVASRILEQTLARPPLVRETSRYSWRPSLQLLPWRRKEASGILDRIIVEEELAQRLQWSAKSLVNAKENGTPFRHLLLHGSPGTGKTLFARTLARQSGLDYAIMSGGDLGPLGREGPNELHKLFQWANRSKKGLILFVDEADAFLRRGRAGAGMSEDARNALSVFLHHTGTESRNVAVILATNVPTILDRAVLDRMDEQFEFPLPQKQQRRQMLDMFLETYLRMPTKSGKGIEVDPAIDEKFLEMMATKTDGMSGRQLAKLVLAFQSAVFGSGTQRLTLGLAETVLQWRLANPSAS
mmetsp:Transcript_25760/g.60154  ORF Transcript_25760/g.60154 Transcript_25760/m.60154 type:complete len:568 (+) Transcript_25760:105-1808(+)